MFSSRAPFTMMASADYYPYPMHTAQDSAPRRRRDLQFRSTSTKPQCNGSPISKHLRPVKPTTAPKPVQRVDSGFDDASDTSSITFTEEVERRFALQQFMDRYHQGPEEEEEDAEEEDEREGDEGNLGRRARDSIDINIERASTWEDKEVRAKRNRRSRLKMVKKWLKRLIYPGSDGSSWLLTASL